MSVPGMIEAKVTSSLKGSIMELIQRDYQFIAGDKIQSMFAEDLVGLVKKCIREPWRMDVGQVLWYGAKVSEKPHYGRSSRNTPLTPVVLTLISREDLEMKKAGYSDREIRQEKIVRLFKEAYEQDALLTHSDVAFLLHVSTGTVSKQVNEYMMENEEVVPTRGVIHDIGRAMTHKRIIVRLYKQGYQTPEIARKINNAMEACDRYIKAYKKVEKLSQKMRLDEISRTLEMGRALVGAYINIMKVDEKK